MVKKNYEELIGAALARRDAEACEAAARVAFNDDTVGEDVLAWTAAMMYENDIRPACDLLETFVHRFPESLHLGRVYLADLLAQAGAYDEATDHARVYLRQAQERGAFPTLAENRVIQDGVSRAVLLLTAAYTELGARSYSTRVLAWGARLALGPTWIKPIRAERLRLHAELKDAASRELDSKWEEFFSNGRHSAELCKTCLERGFPLMARRLDLLESSFRFDPRFKVGEREILMLVQTTDANESVLH